MSVLYEDLLNVYVKLPTGDELKNVVLEVMKNLGDSRTVEVQSMVPIYQ